MLHDHAPTPLSSSKPYIVATMDEISSHDRVILSLLIGLSLAMVVLLIGEARASVAILKSKSGHHPMLSVLPLDDIGQAVAEFKSEPSRLRRLLIVVYCTGLIKPFVYISMMGLCVCAYVMHLFAKDPQTRVESGSERETIR